MSDPARRLFEQSVHAHKAYSDYWIHHQLFTWGWWLQLALAVVPVAAWWMYRKRASTHRLLYAGLFIFTVTSGLDFLGDAFGLWYYPVKLLPTIPPFLPWDLLISVEFMILLQMKPKWSPYLKGILFACGNSFVAEPCFAALHWYQEIHWNTLYSLPIYFVLYLVSYWLSKRSSFAPL